MIRMSLYIGIFGVELSGLSLSLHFSGVHDKGVFIYMTTKIVM